VRPEETLTQLFLPAKYPDRCLRASARLRASLFQSYSLKNSIP